MSQVAWNAKIRVFLRDFDSLEIRAGATVGGQLYVRRFEASHMVVSPIVVGKGAKVRAGSVVYGGTFVGQNWWVGVACISIATLIISVVALTT